ncbi:MAG: pitrilysin family protein [Acholeplasmataceae bacterium]|jgi:predicted Zn-dependent peptidase|nr:pitrilysin family protein [Acholeplasmataceae bacterium]
MITKKYDHFGETVHILKLKNGMQVHILPKEEPYYTTYVELSLPYGAMDLTYLYENIPYQTQYGTAHFLEHKIFAMPEGDAFQMFTSLGVDANAMTSYNQTSYLFVATNKVMEALTHLFNMIDTPYFTDENIESEKSIIAEELKMYLDDPNVVMQNQMMEMMYHAHPLRYDIGGTLDSIKDIDKKTLDHVYAHYYAPNQRLVTIAGKVDLKAIKAFFKAYDLSHPTKAIKPKTLLPKEPKRLVSKHIVETKDINLNKLMIGIKLPLLKSNSKDQIKHELALSLGLNMLLGSSSRMYESLLDKKYINASFYVNTTFEKKAEYMMIYAESKKVYALKKMLVDYLTQEAVNDLDEKSFIRYKKVYLGQFVFALNSIETKAYLYGKYYHMGSSLFDVVDVLQTISYEDVIHALKRIEKKYTATLIYKKA